MGVWKRRGRRGPKEQRVYACGGLERGSADPPEGGGGTECARGDGNAAAKGRGLGGRLAGGEEEKEKIMWTGKSNCRVPEKQRTLWAPTGHPSFRRRQRAEDVMGGHDGMDTKLAPEPGGPKYFRSHIARDTISRTFKTL